MPRYAVLQQDATRDRENLLADLYNEIYIGVIAQKIQALNLSCSNEQTTRYVDQQQAARHRNALNAYTQYRANLDRFYQTIAAMQNNDPDSLADYNMMVAHTLQLIRTPNLSTSFRFRREFLDMQDAIEYRWFGNDPALQFRTSPARAVGQAMMFSGFALFVGSVLSLPPVPLPIPAFLLSVMAAGLFIYTLGLMIHAMGEYVSQLHHDIRNVLHSGRACYEFDTMLDEEYGVQWRGAQQVNQGFGATTGMFAQTGMNNNNQIGYGYGQQPYSQTNTIPSAPPQQYDEYGLPVYNR